MTKLSRNAPCPCGSGLKYKRCCLAMHDTQVMTQKQELQQAQQAQTIIKGRLTERFRRTVVLSHQLPDNFKMSDVILEFAENFLQHAKTDQERDSAFGIACQAWNLALLDEEERESEIKKFKEEMAGNDQQSSKDFDTIVSGLIQNKLQHYSHIKRTILDYQFTGSGKNLRIDVASTLPE